MDTESSYDAVADEYAERIYGELAGKPLDRELLDAFAERVRGHGPVCDLGCGPGQVARYLKDRGVDAFGIDLSPGMLEQARRLNPEIPFRQADMRDLPDADDAMAGIAAFYSLIHIPRAAMVATLRELLRVLRPGAPLLIAFHIGDEVRHLDEWWERPVSVDFLFFQPDEMRGWLEDAGFSIELVLTRDPYPDVEHPSRRCYILASKPTSTPPR